MKIAIVTRPIDSASGALYAALLVLVGVAVMTASAKIQIPFWPVPMTLQVMAVMAFAVFLGPRAAAAIVAAYLMAGAAGAPVFANAPERGVGLAYLAGPTGGYLLGFLAAAWIVGVVARGRDMLGRLAAMAIGLGVIYGLGLAWLAAFIPAAELIAVGFAPFILGDSVKIAVVLAASAAVARLQANTRTP